MPGDEAVGGFGQGEEGSGRAALAAEAAAVALAAEAAAVALAAASAEAAAVPDAARVKVVSVLMAGEKSVAGCVRGCVFAGRRRWGTATASRDG
ncbi:hypothetical protein DXA68_24330, partial [Bacteroides stercorirosoris]